VFDPGDTRHFPAQPPRVRSMNADSDANIMADLAHEGETFCEECEEWVYDDGSHGHAWEPDTVAEARGDK